MAAKLPTIADFRKLNWKIKVTPFRNLNQKARFSSEVELVTEYRAKFITKLSQLPKGGKVIVEIIPPKSNTVFIGAAENHPQLNFDKKFVKYQAFRIALHNAGIR